MAQPHPTLFSMSYSDSGVRQVLPIILHLMTWTAGLLCTQLLFDGEIELVKLLILLRSLVAHFKCIQRFLCNRSFHFWLFNARKILLKMVILCIPVGQACLYRLTEKCCEFKRKIVHTYRAYVHIRSLVTAYTRVESTVWPELQSMAVFTKNSCVQRQNSGVQGSSWRALRLVAQGCPMFVISKVRPFMIEIVGKVSVSHLCFRDIACKH